MKRFVLGFLLLGSLPLFAETYVLSARGGRWTQLQDDAVASANGIVIYSHDETGLGYAESDDPAFDDKLRAGGAFVIAERDTPLRWQEPMRTLDVAQASVVNPNSNTFFALQWAPKAVEAPAAWAAGYTGRGVRVAVLDGGIYDAHPDLAANIDVARSRSFIPGQPFNSDTGTFWHGTHVAGIIAARDNATGVVGIAPEATIVGVKVLHNGTGPFSGIIAGILYAADPIARGGAGADIINLSLGVLFPRAGGGGPLVGALARAINYATSKGVLVVTAVGNDGKDLGQASSWMAVPAESGSGIAVSSTGPLGFANGATNYRRIASYTNFGESLVTVAAPGGDYAYAGSGLCTVAIPAGSVTTNCWAFDMVLSTTRSGYGWAVGTSMAAPAASAVAALIKQRYPMATAGALKTRLQQSADDEGPSGHDQFYGHGFVNARRAVE